MAQSLSKHHHYFFLSIMILMSAVGLFATDVYLPALPQMATHFNCTQSEIQTSFWVFLIGLGSCQFIFGFLGDKFDRKKIVLIGFILFTVASLLCVFAKSLPQFIFLRFLQAIGAGVGSVMSRAIVAANFNRFETVKIFSTTMPLVGVSASIAPFVGGYIADHIDWRGIFYFLAIYGFVTLTLVFFFLKESMHRGTSGSANSEDESPRIAVKEDKLKKTTQFILQTRNYFKYLLNIEFLAYALVVCTGFCVFRSYSIQAPFIFTEMGYSSEDIGKVYLILSAAYFIGNMVAKKLVNIFHMETVLKMGFICMVTGGLSMLSSIFLFEGNPYTIIIPMMIIIFGNGFLFPIGSAAALTSVPANFSGRASGLLGTLQFLIGALCVSWVGELCSGEALSTAVFICSIISVGLAIYFLLMVYKPDRLSETEGFDDV